MADYSLTNVDKLFKTVYGPLSEKLYNSQNIMVARVKKTFDFQGSDLKVTLPSSFGGSVGSGSLPTANTKNYLQASITTKSLYGRMTIDRKSMYAAKDNRGAFVKLLTEAIENTVESYMRNLERILFGDGTGALGTMDGTNSGSDPYTVLISDATWNEANWSKGDYVNVGTGTDLFEVTAINASTKTITLDRISGSQTIGGSDTDVIYMQGSKDNDPIGLAGTVGVASGTPYGINVATETEFASTRIDAGGGDISPQIINQAVLKVHKKCGKYPNLIVTSYEQFIKLQNQLEDAKYVKVSPRDESLKMKIGFDAIEVIAGGRAIPIVIGRFCKASEMFLLNDDHIELLHQSKLSWFNDDGTVLLRQASSDGYEARYGGYLECFIKPCFHAQIHNLSE